MHFLSAYYIISSNERLMMRERDFTTKHERHEKAIQYALRQIKLSPLYPFAKEIILFGSCARKEECFNSDVDLFLVLSEEVRQTGDFARKCRALKSGVTTDEIADAETDLKICIGDKWETSNDTIYVCIRKDGVSLWKELDNIPL